MTILGKVMYSDANGTVIICNGAIPQNTIVEILLPGEQKPVAVVQPPADVPPTVASILAASTKRDGEVVSPEIIAKAAVPPPVRRNANAPQRPPEALQAAQAYEFNLSPEAQAELAAIHREQSSTVSGGGSRPLSVFEDGADPRAEHGVAGPRPRGNRPVSVFDR